MPLAQLKRRIGFEIALYLLYGTAMKKFSMIFWLVVVVPKIQTDSRKIKLSRRNFFLIIRISNVPIPNLTNHLRSIHIHPIQGSGVSLHQPFFPRDAHDVKPEMQIIRFTAQNNLFKDLF